MRVIAMVEVWACVLFGFIVCVGAGLVLLCAVAINSFIHAENDGKEGCDEEHDG